MSVIIQTLAEHWNDPGLESRSFDEDHELENGNYTNICIDCHRQFIGHKRRLTCKKCIGPKIEEPNE